MTYWTMGMSTGLALACLTGGAATAIAPTAPAPLYSRIAPAAAASAAPSATPAPAAVTLEPLAVPGLFTLEIPAGWFTETAETTVITSYDVSANPPTPTDLKTEITVVDESPNTYVGTELDALIEQAYVLDRYGITSVGGNDAFRVWIVQLPGEFANQVITFVGNADRSTAKIVTFYNDDSQATKDLILQMHSSFNFATNGE